MKNKLKNDKGITLVALTITVIVLLIIVNIIIYNVKDNLGVENLKNMQTDIENLTDKVSNYYTEYGAIPAKIEYTNLGNLETARIISSKVDTGKFYIIDLSAIENLTLTYGEDYKKITSETSNEDIQKLEDIYIINEDSHNIFYVKGITIDNEKFYTNYTVDDVDTKEIDLRYIENVKIPDEYTYVSGSKSSGIIIKSDSDEKQYEWIVVENKITDKPSGITVDDEEEFIESVNLYNGYYLSTEDGNNTVVYIPVEQKWSDYYDESTTYQDENGETAIIPKDFRVSRTTGQNTIKNGLVIQDKNGNSYVWIQVPKFIYQNKLYTAGNNGAEVTIDTDYKGIYNVLEAYTSDYRNENYADKWYAISNGAYITEDTEGLTTSQKNLSNGCGLNYDNYINLRNQMLKSIYNNGGFWISQYEVGASSYVSSNDNGSRDAKIEENQYPYNYITCPKAQELATNMDSADKTSSLLFGIQWDLALKFINTNGDKTNSQIESDSSSWGNYSNSNFKVKKGKFLSYSSQEKLWTSVDELENKIYQKNTNLKVLLTTGATRRNSVLNIYDLAGNLWEWTLEKANDENYPCTVRGGNFNDEGSTYGPSVYRGNDNCNSEYVSSSVGFRVAIY